MRETLEIKRFMKNYKQEEGLEVIEVDSDSSDDEISKFYNSQKKKAIEKIKKLVKNRTGK